VNKDKLKSIPISDLENYDKVLSKVTYGNEVIFTESGKAKYAIIDIKKLEHIRAERLLISELRESEISISAKKTYDEKKIRKEFEI